MKRQELVDFAKELQNIGFNPYDDVEQVVDIYLKSTNSMSECERQPVGNNEQSLKLFKMDKNLFYEGLTKLIIAIALFITYYVMDYHRSFLVVMTFVLAYLGIKTMILGLKRRFK